MYYAGMLLNQKTGRFHPIVFYPSPKPSEADDKVVRHRSRCHHNDGFATEDEARQWPPDRTDVTWTDLQFTWDGETSPAMTFYFPRKDT